MVDTERVDNDLGERDFGKTAAREKPRGTGVTN